MRCVFCEMGRCLTHIVREYDYQEALRARSRRVLEPVLEPRLLFDIRTSNTSRSTVPPPPTPHIRSPEIDLMLLQWEVEFLEEQRQRRERAAADRQEITRLLDAADETLKFIIYTGFRHLNDLISKLGQSRSRPSNFDDLKRRRNELCERATARLEQLQSRSEALRSDLQAEARLSQVLDGAHNLMFGVEQISEQVEAMASELLTALAQHTATSSSTGPSAPIRFNSQSRPSDLVLLFPVQYGNALRLASDMINNPTTGPTGFVVFGNPVYHTSRGSSRAGSSRGTAFWIQLGGGFQLVALGHHVEHTANVYQIEWHAAGVKVQTSGASKRVQLNSPTSKLM